MRRAPADQYPAVLALRIGDLPKTASELQRILIQRDESGQPVVLCRLALVDAYRGDADGARCKIDESQV